MSAIVLAILFLASTKTATPRQYRVYTHAKCGYSFVYPRGWVVSNGEQGRPCSVFLRESRNRNISIDQRGVDDYAIRIDSGANGFHEGAKAAGFYVPAEGEHELMTEDEHVGEWLLWGRELPTLAEPLEVGSYKGLKGLAASRCYDEYGYAGQCEEFNAVLINGKRWVSVIASPALEPLDLVVNSICISEVPPN